MEQVFINDNLAIADISYCNEYIHCVNQGFGKLTFGSGTN